MSVDAVQLRLIWLPLTAVAVRLLGAVGGWVSGGAEVVVNVNAFDALAPGFTTVTGLVPATPISLAAIAAVS